MCRDGIFKGMGFLIFSLAFFLFCPPPSRFLDLASLDAVPSPHVRDLILFLLAMGVRVKRFGLSICADVELTDANEGTNV